jgi:hypothetical protein
MFAHAILLASLALWLAHSPLVAQAPSPPAFSPERGLFSQPFALTLSAGESETIRYTTDGSEPALNHGQIYTEPLNVSATTVVRAVSVDGATLSAVATHSFILPATLPLQTGIPSGYPVLWGGNNPADYEIDPEVVALEGDALTAAIEALPNVSLVTHRDNLFDATSGIYLNTLERGIEWERPVSAEILFPDGESVQIDAGVRIHGGGSRFPERNPKHSLRLYFRSDYGPSRFDYPIFGAAGVTSFDKLLLRANYNNTWIHSNYPLNGIVETQRLHAQYVRDQIARDLERDQGQPYIRGRFVHLWLNGLYWGLYNLVERPDSDFAADHFGGDKSEWDVIAALEVKDGTLDAYWTMRGIAETGVEAPEDYQRLLALLDRDNFIDYILLNHYIGSHDWDQSNWYAMRRRLDGERFRFFSWDAEHAMEDVDDLRPLDYSYAYQPTRIFDRALGNPDFRMAVADRIHRHLSGDGALTPENHVALWQERTGQIDQAIVAESARWGDYRRDVQTAPGALDLYLRDPHWLAERQRILTQYLPTRRDVVLNEYRARGLYPAVEAPVLSDSGGQKPVGFSVTIENPNPVDQQGQVVYSLVEDPRADGGATAPSATAYATNIVLAEGRHTLRSRVLRDGEWSALSQAVFVVGLPVGTVAINELHYNPLDLSAPAVAGSELEFIELINHGDEPIDLAGWTLGNAIDPFVFNQATIVEPGEYLVLASNSAEFLAFYGRLADGEYLGQLGNGGETLELRDNLAILVDSVTWDDVPPWPTAPDGLGPSLELIDPELDNALADSWGPSSADWGSPGTANSAVGVDPCLGVALPSLVLAEIHYNPPVAEDSGDWVEVLNFGSSAIDLDGLQFRDEGHSFVIAGETILDAGGSIVIAQDLAAFSALHPSVSNVLGSTGFGLSGGGERIDLATADECVIDEVTYDDALPWPLEADGLGRSLVLTDPLADNTQPEAWWPSARDGGSPGQGNREIVVDGFESGSASRWSNSVPN